MHTSFLGAFAQYIRILILEVVSLCMNKKRTELPSSLSFDYCSGIRKSCEEADVCIKKKVWILGAGRGGVWPFS